jgi:hypothetical protein
MGGRIARLLVVVICVAGAGAGASAAVPAAEAATFTGQLQEVHGHRLDGSIVDQSWRVVNGAARRRLSDPQPAGLVGRTVTITDADPHTPVFEGRVRATADRRVATAPAPGPQSVLVLIITTPDATTPVSDPANVRRAIFTEPDSADAFFARQSGGASSLTGLVDPEGDVAQVAISQLMAGCDYDAVATAALSAADRQGWNTAAYDHRIYLHPHSNSCDYGGLGTLPGNDAWSNGYLQWSVIAHELGHNMGAHHASALDCRDAGGKRVALSGNCTKDEYGDPFDVMGRGGLMSAWHRSQIGQLGTETVSLRASTSLTLSAVDGPAIGLQNLLVPIKEPRVPVSRWYALDVRSAATPFNPFDAGTAATTGITIRIVPALDARLQTQLINTNAASSASRLTAPLQPGATFNDAPHNIAIQARATGSGTVGVDVTMPVLVDDVPPGAVSALRGDGDTSAVTLAWNAASDDEAVDHYEVSRDGAAIGTTAGLSFTDTHTAGLVTATYEVVAVDTSANRGPAVSTQVAVRQLPPPPPVTAPIRPVTTTGPGATTTTITSTLPASSSAASVRGAVIKIATRRTRRLSRGRERVTVTFACSRASTMRVYVGNRRLAKRAASRVQVTFTVMRGRPRTLRVRADFADGFATRRWTFR